MITGDLGAAGTAYREIKRRITEGHYPPGEKLSEMRLAGELGLGRSPIRTALARLQGEGWIAVSPQSGTYVRGLSAKEIAEVIELRLVLESHVAGLAATRISDAELVSLRQAFDALAPGVEDHVEDALDLDLKLHMAIYAVAGNELIARTLTDIVDKILWIRRSSAATPWRIRESFDEALAILEALERRDPQAASRAMFEHISRIRLFRTGGTEMDGLQERVQLRAGRSGVGT